LAGSYLELASKLRFGRVASCLPKAGSPLSAKQLLCRGREKLASNQTQAVFIFILFIYRYSNHYI